MLPILVIWVIFNLYKSIFSNSVFNKISSLFTLLLYSKNGVNDFFEYLLILSILLIENSINLLIFNNVFWILYVFL